MFPFLLLSVCILWYPLLPLQQTAIVFLCEQHALLNLSECP